MLFGITFLRDVHNDLKLCRPAVPLYQLRLQKHMAQLTMDHNILFTGIEPRIVNMAARTVIARLAAPQNPFIADTSPKLFTVQIKPLHHRLVHIKDFIGERITDIDGFTDLIEQPFRSDKFGRAARLIVLPIDITAILSCTLRLILRFIRMLIKLGIRRAMDSIDCRPHRGR